MIDEHYITVNNELYELLWRKEERGEVMWIKGKTYEALNRKFAKLTQIPRDDDSFTKKVNPLYLKPFFWARSWKKLLPLHKEKFTNSKIKIITAIETDCFELLSLAEIIYQSNPALFNIHGAQTMIENNKMIQVLKKRLPGDLGYGIDYNKISWKEANRKKKELEKKEQNEDAIFWKRMSIALGDETRINDDEKRESKKLSKRK